MLARRSHVFISYVREDSSTIDRLSKELKSQGIKVWLDRDSIAAGIRWKPAIRRAIQQGSFFIACFSKSYQARAMTYMNEELTLAIEVLRQHPVDRAWFIPVKLDQTPIMARDIGAGETLRDLQYVDLSENWEEGILKLLVAIDPRPNQAHELVKDLGSELLQAWYQDWVSSERDSDYLLDKTNISLVLRHLVPANLSLELSEYVFRSILFRFRVDELDNEYLAAWLHSTNTAYLLHRLLDDIDGRVKLGVIELILHFKLDSVADLLISRVMSETDIDTKRAMLKCILHLGEHLSSDAAQLLLDIEKDWLIQSYALRDSNNYRAALMLSDGTDFAAQLQAMAEEAGFRVVLVTSLAGSEHVLLTSLLEIEDEVLQGYELLIFVRGNHYGRFHPDTVYSKIKSFVSKGGALFATSWTSWESIDSQEFSDLLPFAHPYAGFEENGLVICEATGSELARELFPNQLSFRTSYELLRARGSATVLFETINGIPIFGYRPYGQGKCFYLNSCQHSCLKAMASPFDDNNQFGTAMKHVIKWIFDQQAGRVYKV